MGLYHSSELEVGRDDSNRPRHYIKEREITFDREYGFPNGRKLLEPKSGKKEWDSAHVPELFRNNCADAYLLLLKCRRYNFPFNYRCEEERHAVYHCMNQRGDSAVMEWEREQRLRARKARKEAAAAAQGN